MNDFFLSPQDISAIFGSKKVRKMKKEKLVTGLGGLKEWTIILLLVALTLFVIYII